jgi:hypothetical protein
MTEDEPAALCAVALGAPFVGNASPTLKPFDEEVASRGRVGAAREERAKIAD